MKIDVWDFVLFSVVLIQIFVCPYTKVEESFNLQATHDFLYHRFDIEKFDHHEFPGVVPRSFLGAFFVSVLSAPFQILASLLGSKKLVSQYIVRAVLGLLNVLSLSYMRKIAEKHLGKDTGKFLMLVYAIQFHLPFYFSRTFPNNFALILVYAIQLPFYFSRTFANNFALIFVHILYGELMNNNFSNVIALFAVSGLIFRSELILLALPIGLMILFSKKISFFDIIKIGVVSAVLSLVVTVLFDSIMWGRLLWPEGEVLYFNTFLNKSHLWGTLPYYWYFLAAIPKTMHISLLPFIVGLYFDFKENKFLLKLLFPVLIFLFLYSFLPHKELRFIFYVFPILNLVSAFGFTRMIKKKGNPKLILIGITLLFIASLVISGGFLYISSLNYPGGVAFTRLHQIESDRSDVFVHIGADAAMTGVSRFGELRPDWKYSKEENETNYLKYSHLITSHQTLIENSNFEVLETVNGFSHVTKSFPFVHVSPQIWLLKRK